MDDTTKQEIERLSRTIAEQNARISDLEDTITHLETQLDFIGDITKTKSTKEQKIASIVQYAKNRYENDNTLDAIKITPRTITGIIDVSDRYAYTLIDDMNRDYDWAHKARDIDQYGDVERTKSQRGIIVDFEGVHGPPVEVNKFINETKGVTA